jgi:hypothetical protein
VLFALNVYHQLVGLTLVLQHVHRVNTPLVVVDPLQAHVIQACMGILFWVRVLSAPLDDTRTSLVMEKKMMCVMYLVVVNVRLPALIAVLQLLALQQLTLALVASIKMTQQTL